MKQHKWHKEIKAWANGAEIEIRQFDGNRNDWTLWNKSDLFTLSQLEKLSEDKWQVRIKPQPVEPQYLYAYKFNSDIRLWSEKTESPNYIGKIPLIVESNDAN